MLNKRGKYITKNIFSKVHRIKKLYEISKTFI